MMVDYRNVPHLVGSIAQVRDIANGTTLISMMSSIDMNSLRVQPPL